MADLLMESPLNLEQRNHVRIFQNAGETLLNVINDILDLSKVEAGRMELERIPFNLRTLVSETCDLIAVAAREKGLQTTVTKAVSETPKKTKPGQVSTGQVFDIARFAGIFAVIGLAIGAIGTAIASMVTGFLKLAWWKMPLAAFGLILVISGPSMIVAYLKLRKRNLGPILDASGWAVNTRAKINIPFGTSLTGTAVLPPGSRRSMQDPFAQKKRPWKFYMLLLGILVTAGVLLHQGYLKKWWQGSVVREKTSQVTDGAKPAQRPVPPASSKG